MHTNEGEIIHVEANSLGDFANGKRLFARFSDKIKQVGGAKYGQLISMGVIEGGTESGSPSCMFLVHHSGKAEDGSQDQFFVFETTASSLKHLAEAVQKCEAYFNQKTGEAQ